MKKKPEFTRKEIEILRNPGGTALGLLDEEAQKLFYRAIEAGVMTWFDGDSWKTADRLGAAFAYRVDESKVDVKQSVVRYQVIKGDSDRYWIKGTGTTLDDATSLIRFAGYEYEDGSVSFILDRGKGVPKFALLTED